MKNILSISEASRKLCEEGMNISPRTLHRAIKRAGFKVVRVGTSFGITIDQARTAYTCHTQSGRRAKV